MSKLLNLNVERNSLPVPMLAMAGWRDALVLARKRKGVSQADVERRGNLPTSQLSRYERGEREPGIESFGQVLDGLGMSLAEFAALLDEINGRAPTLARTGTESASGPDDAFAAFASAVLQHLPEAERPAAARRLYERFIERERLHARLATVDTHED